MIEAINYGFTDILLYALYNCSTIEYSLHDIFVYFDSGHKIIWAYVLNRSSHHMHFYCPTRLSTKRNSAFNCLRILISRNVVKVCIVCWPFPTPKSHQKRMSNLHSLLFHLWAKIQLFYFKLIILWKISFSLLKTTLVLIFTINY